MRDVGRESGMGIGGTGLRFETQVDGRVSRMKGF